MDYIEISPQKELSPFVKCFWEYKSMDNDVTHTILPNGYFELIMVMEGGKFVSVFLSGLRTKPFDVYVPKEVSVFAIRFKLLAAEYLFDREIRPVLETTLPLDLNFWNLKNLASLSFADRTNEMSQILSGIIMRKEIDHEKLLLLTTVYTPDLSVKDVSEITHWDRRRIHRYFNKQFGLSLKTFLSIIRLRNSFESIKDGILHPEFNYYDQSHFIKEVKKYTGKSPKILSKNESDRFLQFSVNKKP